MIMRPISPFILSSFLVFALPLTDARADDLIRGPFVGAAVIGHETAALASLPRAAPRHIPVPVRRRHNPLAAEPHRGLRGTADHQMASSTFSGMPVESEGRAQSPAPLLTFDGQGNDTCLCSPPDTVGDVGPNHYVQVVNATGVAIYNKSGQLLPGYPKDLSSLFAGGDCAVSNNGDPVVLYDSMADRWLLAQFSLGNGVCVAISQTPDPTGAYFGYEFITPDFPDYLKFGVWPDGYYMSTNESTYAAYAFDRRRMLQGLPSTSIRFDGVSNFMLPSDVDGGPPPQGAPNYFYTFKDNAFHGTATDRLEIRGFRANFANPAASTFTLNNTIDIAPFTYTVCGFFIFDCIPQRDTPQKVDAVSEWPMFRFPYRNFLDHESLAGTFSVDRGGNTAALRWFELRKTGGNWTLYQQGTLGSNDGVSRWMGSIAMDAAGNLALGYSVSSASMFPAIRYAVHRIGDALGTMQPEATLKAGGGSQFDSDRWGDYTAMSIDPADGATFWYTNQYYKTSSAVEWSTRIGAFSVLQSDSFRSVAAYDGTITELTETSGTGGSINAISTVLNVGDDGQDRQVRAVLDFNTAALPDNAVIGRAVLRLAKANPAPGTDPFINLGRLRIGLNDGGLAGRIILEPQDFQAPVSEGFAAAFRQSPAAVLTASLRPDVLPSINRTGHTQMLLRFILDDDDDRSADLIQFFSGNAAPAASRPQLEISYYVP